MARKIIRIKKVQQDEIMLESDEYGNVTVTRDEDHVILTEPETLLLMDLLDNMISWEVG